MVTLQLAGPYVEGVQTAVGAQLLEDEGSTDAQPEAQLARGQEAFADWITENGVDIDPEFGIELDNGQVTPVDTSLSVPVGDSAKAAAKEDVSDQEYATSLPAAHTCD